MHEIDLSSLDSKDDLLVHEEDLKSQIEDEVSENDDNEHKELSPVLKKIKEQVPSLFKLGAFAASKLPKKKSKSVKAEIDTSTKQPKKKTKFKVIHVVFLIGFAFLLFEEELIGTEEIKNDSRPVVAKKEKLEPVDKVIIKDPKPVVNNEDPLMIGNSKPLVEDVKKDVAQVDVDPIKPNEDITDLFKDEMDIDTSNNNNSENVDDAIESINAQADAINNIESNTDINTDISVDEAQDLPNIDIEVEDSIINADISETKEAKQALELKRIEESKAVVDSKVEDDITDDFLVKDFNSAQDITKSIIEDLQQKVDDKKNQDLINKNANYDLLDSVNYELHGRGLVYNCNDGHWACVNIKSYSYCQNNYNYDLQNQKQIQCYPSAIYEGSIDCEDEQLNKVSNSASTNFCN